MLKPVQRHFISRIPGSQRDKERQQDTRDGGMHAWLKHEKPQYSPRQQIGQQARHAGTVQAKQQSNHCRCTTQHQKRNVAGIEERDDSHRPHVIQNSQRRQENF